MSLDVETHTHSHAHATGRRWVDLTVAFSALFISIVSLGVAILHGRTMDRLVAANSWPFLSYGAGIITADGVTAVHMRVFNAGVGPAKIESAELVWKGVAYRSDREFLAACCGVEPGSAKFDSDLLPNEVLRAGQVIDFLSFKQSANPTAFAALEQAMISRDLQLPVCYCSIFNECWKTDLATLSLTPAQVMTCVQPKVMFDQGVWNGNK